MTDDVSEEEAQLPPEATPVDTELEAQAEDAPEVPTSEGATGAVEEVVPEAAPTTEDLSTASSDSGGESSEVSTEEENPPGADSASSEESTPAPDTASADTASSVEESTEAPATESSEEVAEEPGNPTLGVASSSAAPSADTDLSLTQSSSPRWQCLANGGRPSECPPFVSTVSPNAQVLCLNCGSSDVIAL